MGVNINKNPAEATAGQGGAQGSASMLDFTPKQAVALAVNKPGRGSSGDGWVVVAKITHFLGSSEPILATVWRSQQGTREAISLPAAIIEFAKQAGVTRFCLRDDRRRLAWTCPLDLFNRGKLQADGERYIPLNWLTPCPWRDWEFAKTVVRIPEVDRQEAANLRQLSLPL